MIPRLIASKYSPGILISFGGALAFLFLGTAGAFLDIRPCVPDGLHCYATHGCDFTVCHSKPIQDLNLSFQAGLGLLCYAEVGEHQASRLRIGGIAHFLFPLPFLGFFFARAFNVRTTAGVVSQMSAISEFPKPSRLKTATRSCVRWSSFTAM